MPDARPADPVKVERRDQVMEITLDRPKANAIDPATSQRLGDVFAEFRDDPGLCVAIVTGAGRFFSAGWDLKEASPNQDFGRGGFAGLTEMFNLKKPVIAAVNGIAAGGGFELALACDMIVAADTAEFMLPEVRIGLIPDSGGVLRLPKRLPRALASELILTGRRMGAAEADRHGLLNRLVPLAELMPTARALAAEVVAAAPLAVMAAKAVLQATEALSVEEGYRLMASGTIPEYRRMLDSEDYWEGPKAFAEKRPPVWKGR
ncbi:MAG: enoyl-CoA hydratase-related protein [Pseudomonadota bacterium]